MPGAIAYADDPPIGDIHIEANIICRTVADDRDTVPDTPLQGHRQRLAERLGQVGERHLLRADGPAAQVRRIDVQRRGDAQRDDLHAVARCVVAGYSLAFPDNYDLARLACFFSADYPSEARENPEKLIPFMTCLRRWQESWQHPDPPELSIRQSAGEQWQISDTRDSALTPVRVIGREGYELLKYCRRGRPMGVVDNKTLAHDFLSSGFLIEVDGKLISLVCDSSVSFK